MVDQLDLKSVFFILSYKKKIYVNQLLGFILNGFENKVYKLKMAPYDSKQTSRTWYNHIDAYFEIHKF